MEAKILPFATPVRVAWLDSKSLGGWRAEPDGLTPGRVESLGFVALASELGLAITSSIGEEKLVYDPYVIPWGCIEDCEELPFELCGSL